jgi:hypothetical protein
MLGEHCVRNAGLEGLNPPLLLHHPVFSSRKGRPAPTPALSSSHSWVSSIGQSIQRTDGSAHGQVGNAHGQVGNVQLLGGGLQVMPEQNLDAAQVDSRIHPPALSVAMTSREVTLEINNR